jgi:hypothetical protein
LKVTHHGDEHLIRLSSDEVALLVDMCHAAVISDHLTAEKDTTRRLRTFMGEVQISLFDTAQAVWARKRRIRKFSTSRLPADPAVGPIPPAGSPQAGTPQEG